MQIKIPKDHPRYLSLITREKIIEGGKKSVVAPAGLIAHGRGEAYDYLIGEITEEFALSAIKAAAASFLTARHPVISVNGNIAALVPEELVILSRETGAPLEINLFYRSRKRERAILKALKAAGAKQVLGYGRKASARIPEVGSERRRVDPEGIGKADLVLVPLEDGDRTEGLVNMGKTVITIDLNPLSRTAQRSTISIVDNVIRVLPLLIREVQCLKKKSAEDLQNILLSYDNKAVLKASLDFISRRLKEIGKKQNEET